MDFQSRTQRAFQAMLNVLKDQSINGKQQKSKAAPSEGLQSKLGKLKKIEMTTKKLKEIKRRLIQVSKLLQECNNSKAILMNHINHVELQLIKVKGEFVEQQFKDFLSSQKQISEQSKITLLSVLGDSKQLLLSKRKRNFSEMNLEGCRFQKKNTIKSVPFLSCLDLRQPLIYRSTGLVNSEPLQLEQNVALQNKLNTRTVDSIWGGSTFWCKTGAQSVPNSDYGQMVFQEMSKDCKLLRLNGSEIKKLETSEKSLDEHMPNVIPDLNRNEENSEPVAINPLIKTSQINEQTCSLVGGQVS